MDLEKIGRFIKEQRKTKNLTQSQLASKLFVSEKTISKWECGKGFPDATLIMPLCKELDINSNELLSGKFLTDEKAYKESAEKNLVELKNRQEKTTKLLLALECVLGVFSVVIIMCFCVIAEIIDMPDWLRIILCIVGLIIGCVGLHFCMVIEKDAGFYECRHCQYKYVPSMSQMYFSRHIGRSRNMKCPKCNKRSYHRKVISED